MNVHDLNNPVTTTTREGHEPRGKAVAISVGDHTFGSTVDARSYTSELLNASAMYTPLVGTVAAFVEALFARHPHAVEKAGVGIDHFEVRPGPTWPTRNFWLVRRDGTVDNFSIKKCLHITAPAQDNAGTGRGGAR